MHKAKTSLDKALRICDSKTYVFKAYNDFSDYESNVTDPEILKVLSDYRIKRENAEKEMGSPKL